MDPQEAIMRNRKKLDMLTVGLVRLMAARDRAAIRIERAKRRLGSRVLDRNREKAVLDRAQALASRCGVDGKVVVRIMRILMRHSRRIQQ
jgi:chorismate mutase